MNDPKITLTPPAYGEAKQAKERKTLAEREREELLWLLNCAIEASYAQPSGLVSLLLTKEQAMAIQSHLTIYRYSENDMEIIRVLLAEARGVRERCGELYLDDTR